MAEVLETHDFPRAGRIKFNVPDEWLDGKIHRLHAPGDFEPGKGKTVANAVKRAAQEAGKSVLVDDREVDRNVVVVQAIPRRTRNVSRNGSGKEGAAKEGAVAKKK